MKRLSEAKKAIKSTDPKESHRLLNTANALRRESQKVIPPPIKEPLHVNDTIKYGSSKGVIKSIKRRSDDRMRWHNASCTAFKAQTLRQSSTAQEKICRNFQRDT